MNAPTLAQPRAPVFDAATLRGPARRALPEGILGLPHQAWTTSGRAALWQALALLDPAPGAGVLVPTYHCPTLVAPVVDRGLRPVFYPLDDTGRPQLAALEALAPADARAIVVPHLFGRAQSLAEVRAWCDRRGVALIEDCAHTPFGRAGERAVGHWGDLATASLTKFLPVPEAGLLASATRALDGLALRPAPAAQQLKAVLEVLDRGPARGRIGAALAGLRPRRAPPPPAAAPARDAPPACDLSRVGQRPTWIARLFARHLPLEASLAARRRHFDLLRRHTAGLPGCRPLWDGPAGDAAPYVFPLYVEAPEAVYAGLRAAGCAVLRWDIVWPGTPQDPADPGSRWSRHVLQLLCHQSLRPDDLARTGQVLRGLVAGA